MENPTVNSTQVSAEMTPMAAVRSDVDALLSAHYDAQALRSRAMSDDYEFLWQTLNRQNRAGGKRLRPYLCVLAYEAMGGTDYQAVIPVAAGLELLHTAMLIHDDIIDRDYSRRGQPNVAGMYQTKYADLLQNDSEKNHFANSAALLAGDLALSDSYQLVLASSIDSDTKIKILHIIGDAIYNAVGGELLDSEAALYPLDKAASLKIAELKTAQYSFAAPLSAGAILAGASQDVQQKLQLFGTKLGIAFQLADDLLGVFGNPKETGKSTISDIREGKRTYLLQQTMLAATTDQKNILEGIIGNSKCDEPMADQARLIMVACGAKTTTELLMQTYADAAQKILRALPVSAEALEQFEIFSHQAVWRKR